jgi:hypothetical protein
MTARACRNSDTHRIARVRLPPIVTSCSPAEKRWVSQVLNRSDALLRTTRMFLIQFSNSEFRTRICNPAARIAPEFCKAFRPKE